MPNNKVWLQAYFLWPYVENPHCLAVWLVKNKLWVSFVAKVSRCGRPLEIDLNPGWLFGTFFIFHNIWDNPFHWLLFFKIVKTTNQLSCLGKSWLAAWCVVSNMCGLPSLFTKYVVIIATDLYALFPLVDGVTLHFSPMNTTIPRPPFSPMVLGITGSAAFKNHVLAS